MPPQTTPRPLALRPTRLFVWRTPLLPLSELMGLSEGLLAPGAAPESLADALAKDRRLLQGRLRAWLERPEVREALFIASPALESNLDAWLSAPDSEAGAKVERTLVRYLARMSARHTPFGLFAGCSTGRLAEQTRLSLEPLASYRRRTRLDAEYLGALTEALVTQEGVRAGLRYQPNSSLYAASGRLRYCEQQRVGGARTYRLVAVESSPYLDLVFATARAGARQRELVDALLAKDSELSSEEAEGFLEELVSMQLLVPLVQPRVTGPEALEAMVGSLQDVPACEPALRVLRETGAALAALDAAGPGQPPRRYREVAEGLGALPVPADPSRLFQVDLFKPAPDATLGADVVAELQRAVGLLHRITPPAEHPALVQFREDFVARYEDREVPLAEVLDEETGVGFGRSTAPGTEGSPLLATLAFPGRPPDEAAPWGPRERHLLGRLTEVLARGARELELEEEDLQRLEVREPLPLPDALSCSATVVSPGPRALAEGRFQLLLGVVSGPSGARLLGRFCHGDPAVRECVDEHLRAEEALRPDAVFAEVVHLPADRNGNILARPVLREHEVVFLGGSGADAGRQLPISDLRVSVRGQRVVLRSERLGREVLPRLTTAHNWATSGQLGLYRFLCALQFQGVTGGLVFNWGALEASPFLPRVTAGRLILALARWRIPAQVLRAWRDVSALDAFRAVQAYRREARLPRWVMVVDGDNHLPVDLDNALCVDSFVHLVRRRGGVTLEELFPGPEGLCAEGPEGAFTHELILPLVRRDESPRPPPRESPGGASEAAPRSFPPGSQWLYARLHGGVSTADRIVREVLPPVVEQALCSKAADGWFFIRHGDPSWHVRVRFRGEPERLLREVWPALRQALAPLQEDGSVWRVQWDTYERELTRYGGAEGMLLSEQLFMEDSAAVLALLRAYPGEAAAEARWRLTLLGMDRLMEDLGLELSQRLSVVERMREGFGREFNVGAHFERQLGERFRQERRALEALLWAPGPGAFEEGREVLARRSERLRPVAQALRQAEREGRLTTGLLDLTGSYLHMHANRMLRSSARAQELVLHDLLARLYRSRLARARRAGGAAVEP